MDDTVRADRLLEAGLTLASELSLPAVLQRIVELAADVIGARYGALGVIGPDGGIVEFVTHGVTAEQRAHIGALPIGQGILGLLITEARPIRLREIGDDPHSVGFPPNHPEMHSFLGAPVKARGRVFGNIYLTEKQGAAEFSEEDQRALVILAAQAGVAVDNAHLYEEARQRERRLEAMREITTAILEGGDRRGILQLVADRARELVGGATATVAIPGGQDDALVIDVASGDHADDLLGMGFPVRASVSGQVMTTGVAEILADAAADRRIHQPFVQVGEIGPAMFVPLSASGRTLGTLAVGNHRGGMQFGAEHLALVEALAGQASVAIEYVRAQEELTRLSVMEDRERIAKELHDGVIQSLFAVGMGLQATAQMSGIEAVEQRIESAVTEVDRVIRDLRNYIFGLQPGILADRQLDQALRHLIEEFQERSSVTAVVDVDTTIAAELASKAGDVVQFVRESLSNVERHAGAETCRVSLRRLDDAAELTIDDDGRGFDLDAKFGTGSGLPNLKERAASLRGDLTIESEPGAGTTVRLVIAL